MSELRKDYILERWVIIATGRAKRPQDFAKKKGKEDAKGCPFCPGNESMTPPEISRVEKNGRWVVRVFPNKYPAVSAKKGKASKPKRFLIKKGAVGRHEMLVETPYHGKQLGELAIEQISLVLKEYAERTKALGKHGYVLIFKNEGEEAGASRSHAHTQIVAYNKTPRAVEEELKAVQKFKTCPYCSIIRMESRSLRRIFENKGFIAFAPFASRFPFEAWIFPKKHMGSITEVNDFKGLAEVLKKVLAKLKKLNAPYNFYIHNSPKGKGLHFHIEITPRLAKWAGFEFGTGTVINVMSPEGAADFYRKKHS